MIKGDIRFYDFEFNLLHIATDYISANWNVYYNRIGNFEAHFNLNSELTKILFENDYVVAVQGDFAAIITGKQVTDELGVFGRTCNWLISKRITPKFGHTSGTAETMVENFVATAFSDIFEADKGIFFECDGEFTNEFTFWRNNFHPTSEVVIDCLDRDEGGHTLLFLPTEQKWIFKIYKGKENPLIISEDNKNAFELEFNGDCLDYYTGGWYEKENTETDEIEVFQVVRDSDKQGIYRWECCLDGASESEGISELKRKQMKKTVKAICNLEYGKDYLLGDIVSVQINKGVLKNTFKKRVKGIRFRTEAGVSEIQPVFEDL